jgi:glycosyltransferase involved in cell wall biosynthesis
VIYYFLPDRGIFGGVKVAFRFLEELGALGVPGVAVLPDGRAPEWFASRVPVVSEADALARLRPDDWKMITWPPDHERLRGLPGRMVCHCQGTDVRMDAIFADADVLLLTCWDQCAHVARERFGRTPIEVGITIPNGFLFAGERKLDDLVAYMPRRGVDHARACMRAAKHLDFDAIDGEPEDEVARRLKRAGVFLATAVGEEFGLPALEAMAAGCVVLSVPVKGGTEFLHDGDDCVVCEPGDLPRRLLELAAPSAAATRARLRQRAVATAARYLPSRRRARLTSLLAGELRVLAS